MRPRYIFTFVATVGTTITPYMQVYIQSSMAEKNLTSWVYDPERSTACDVVR
jgi:Mn2+/Fe2+ NRAMP family transporter